MIGRYLESQSFEIVRCNYYTRFGEIDIVARRGDTLHFIEVKSGPDFDHAVQNMTPKKLAVFSKVSRSISSALALHVTTRLMRRL